MSKKVTIKIVLDTRRAKISGLFPVKIRVTFQREQKYFPVYAPGKRTSLDLSPDDFTRVYGEKPRADFKEYRFYLDTIERRANNALEDLQAFSFAEFEASLFGEQTAKKSGTLVEAFEAKIKLLLEQGRISSAKSYSSSLNSLTGFAPKVNFSDVGPQFLREYQFYMDKGGNSVATTGLYLRNLRAIFNEAIEEGLISRDTYPFGKGKRRFQIPSKGNKAEPLKQSEVAKIYTYQTQNEAEARARDLWVFAFLLNGANMKDVCFLKFRDIDFHGERITFYRSKTSKTAKEQKPIEVSFTKTMRAIIDRWGNPPGNPDEYVFPFFKKGMTATEQYRANGNIRKTLNKYLERIAENLGIEKTNIHNYTGRDSFAAAQRLAGESGDAIGEAFGHENRATTDAYLDKFGKDTKDRLANNALRFIGEEDTPEK
jgi:integrase/recombinase XerD